MFARCQQRLFSKMRTGMFVGGNNAKALAKAVSGVTGADFVILDLEDAVGPAHKEAARTAVLAALDTSAANGVNTVVRLNGLDTPWGAADLAAFEDKGVRLLFPKVVDPAKDLPAHIPRALLWANVETARGVLNAPRIAAATSCLVAGTQDLSVDLRLPRPIAADRQPLLHSLQAMVLAARAEGVPCLDGVSVAYKDLAPLEAEAAQGHALGFDGKTLIHPAQVPVVRRIFSPSEEALAGAEKVREAWETVEKPNGVHPGLATVDGKMVEELHYRDALRILALKDE